MERHVANYPRSKYESEFELAYAVGMAALHCRLYRNIQRGVGWINVFAGSASVASVLNGFPHVAVFFGIVTTALSAYDLYFKPGETADAHERDKRAFGKLQAKAGSMTLEKLDAATARIRIDAAPTFDVLSRPVYNDTCRTFGRTEYLLKLTRRERLARWLA